MVTDPSPVDESEISGSCDSAEVLEGDGFTYAGGAILDGTFTAVAGGAVADDVITMVFSTTDGEDVSADIEAGAWVVVASTELEFDSLRVERPDGTEACPVLPASDLVAGHPVCGP